MRAETRHQLKQDAFSRVTIGAAEKTADWTVQHRSTLIISAIVAVVLIGGVIGGWYYLRITAVMYLRNPPVPERAPLVTCPFRAFLHLATDAERLEALVAARELLLPGGRVVFDVFAPSDEDIAETNGLWLEREPGIFERADWDRRHQTLTLSVRGAPGESSMILWWLEPQRWQALLAEAGFAVEACYGWFDRRPYDGGEDCVWVARK